MNEQRLFGGIFDFAVKQERLEEVNRELEDSAVWNNPEHAQALGKEKVTLEQIVETIEILEQGVEDVEGLLELAVEAEDEDTFAETQSELAELIPILNYLNFAVCLLDLMTVMIVIWIFNQDQAAPKHKIGLICYYACICVGVKKTALKPNSLKSLMAMWQALNLQPFALVENTPTVG